MSAEDFLKSEYATLRAEIEHSKARLFRILSIGIPAVPVAQLAAGHLDALALKVFIPLIPVTLGMLFLAENHGIMRCGQYIRERIEPRLLDAGGGWENWLENGRGYSRRSVDRLLSISAMLLFTAYFLLSTVVAYVSAREADEGAYWPFIMLAVYGSLVAVLFPLFGRTVRNSTKMKTARPAAVPVPVAVPPPQVETKA